MQGLRTAPNAVYALVQTALVQDEALKRAHDRIQELEAAQPGSKPSPAVSSIRCAMRSSDRASRTVRLGAARPRARHRAAARSGTAAR